MLLTRPDKVLSRTQTNTHKHRYGVQERLVDERIKTEDTDLQLTVHSDSLRMLFNQALCVLVRAVEIP